MFVDKNGKARYFTIWAEKQYLQTISLRIHEIWFIEQKENITKQVSFMG